MQLHAYPFHDANRTQISKTEMPVLNSRGVKVGCASSAAGARTLLNAPASMQQVNGGRVRRNWLQQHRELESRTLTKC